MVRFRALLALAVLAITSDATSDDSLDANEIMRVITAHRSEVRRCYTDALKQKPDLKGKVKLRVVIAPSGRVASATDDKSDIPDMGVRKCVTDEVVKLVFPSSSGSTAVNLPFVFVPGDVVVDGGAPVDASRG